MNERLDEIGEAAPWSKTTDYLCECSDTAVFWKHRTREGRVRAGAVRSTVFFVVPGTERPAIEHVIEEHERYLLVEKTVAVDSVIESDPRSGGPRLCLAQGCVAPPTE